MTQGMNELKKHGCYVQMGVLSDLVTADWKEAYETAEKDVNAVKVMLEP